MGYLPTSPQRNSPGRVGVGKNLLLSRGENVRPLMVPSPRSPGARRLDRPLADILNENEFNPLRKKYDPSAQMPRASSHLPSILKGRSHQTPGIGGLPAGLPFADDEPATTTSVLGLSSNSPVSPGMISASSFSRSSRRSVNLERSPEPPATNSGSPAATPAIRRSRCYAYVPIPHTAPSVKSNTTLVAKPTVDRKKNVSFVTGIRAPAPVRPEWEDTRELDRQRIEELQRELEAIESSKATELQAIRDEVQRAKQLLDEEIRASADRAELNDMKLRENRQILAGLKAENNKIRRLNRGMAENNRNLRINNDRLESSLKTTLHLHVKLNEYQRKEAQTQQSLESKCRKLDQSIQWLLYQVEETDDYARRQNVHVIAYKEAFDALAPLLARNGHPVLAREVRILYESVSAKNSEKQGRAVSGSVHADADTCSETLSSIEMESDSEFDLCVEVY